jgi:acyl-CoA reductase-like NAD-dependent aldehyde dehydrogenase
LTTVAANLSTQLFIDGVWEPGSAGCFDVVNPSTGSPIASVARAGLDDLDRALAAAVRAGPGWADTAPRERAEVLRRAFELMISRKADIAFLMSLEMGKSLTDARAEVAYAAEYFRWFAEEAVRSVASVTIRSEPDADVQETGRGVAIADPVELPGGDGDAQDRAGTGRRMHDGPQTG